MQHFDPTSDEEGVPPLLNATWHLDEAVKVLRNRIPRPFPEPAPNATVGDCMDAWYRAEKASRTECEEAIREWIDRRILPILDDGAAYFVLRRFDQASEYLQNLFLDDQTTVFSCAGHSLDDVLWWILVDWWEAHGSRLAHIQDDWDDDYEFLMKNAEQAATGQPSLAALSDTPPVT